MDEFRLLLNRFWVRRDEDLELFYQVRRKLPALRRALREQFGWEIVSTEKVIRLVKQPAKAAPAFGIRSFTSVSDYCLLCGLLLVLEDQDDGQRFLLSELTQALQAHLKPYCPDLSWERYQHRTSLVRVLQYAEQTGLVRSCEGESDGFKEHREQEVLYENTGLSRFFSVNFHRDISGFQSVRDFEQPEDGPDQERGVFRTYRVFRQLALGPAAYWDEPSDAVYAYIKNMRGTVQRVLDETIGGKLQVYHNGAFFLPDEGAPCGDLFPRDQMLSDVLLLLFERLSEKIALSAYPHGPDDRVHLPLEAFSRELDACRREYRAQWGKTFAEKELSALVQDVLNELAYWDFAEERGGVVTLNPAIALWHGIYPNNRRSGHARTLADE